MRRLIRRCTPEVAPPSSPTPANVDRCLETLETIARQRLEEASNMRTPCCGTVLEDFDNCFCIRCRVCPKFMCAWCLTYTDDDSDTCHEHVRNCPENPHPGAVYGDIVYWEDVHRPRKRAKRLEEEQMSLVSRIGDSTRRLIRVGESLA